MKENLLKYNIKALIGNKNMNKFICVKKLDKESKKILTPNKQYKDKHLGKRCFIIGNGPSINKQDLSQLTNEITFTVNQLPRNNIFEKINTNYHLWVDDRFFKIDKNKPEDMELLNVMKSVNTTNNKPVVFYKLSARKMVEEFKLNELLNIRYFQEGLIFNEEFNEEFDFTKLIPGYPTVVFYAISLAIYMGFKEIYLLGCDCTGFITTAQSLLKTNDNELLYGYKISENEKKRLQQSNSTYSIGDELLWHSYLFKDYEIFYRYCEKRNIKLVNCTAGGLLNLIPRMVLNEILQ